MGLDLTTIDLPINLKLWHDAGLRSILSDPETVKAAYAQKTSAAPAPAAPKARPAARPAGSTRPPQPAPRPSVPPRPTIAPKPTAPSRPTRQVPAQQAKPQTPPLPRHSPRKSPTKVNLPPRLREYFANINVPVFSLWTYWELPVDLSENPDPDRQKLIKGMLGALRWKQGSSVFWPMSRMENNVLVPDLDIFAYGLQAITPVYIFCFGTRGSSLLLPDQELTVFKRYTSPHTSSPVQTLPGFEDMLPDNKKSKAVTWNILKSYTPLPM